LYKISKLFLLLLIFLSVNISAQKKLTKGNYISIIVPEENNAKTFLSKYRLAANTKPGSKVTINGKKLKVYSSGAFVDLMDLELGKNKFIIKSKYKNGETISKKFAIFRETKKLKTSSKNKLIIEDELMLPSENTWLDSGNILNVRIKGTPGCKATFMDNIKMIELPKSETKGIAGVYTGVYKVKSEDTFEDIVINFVLEKDGKKISKKSKAKITMNPSIIPRVGVLVGDRPYLNHGLGTNRLGGAKLAFLEKDIKICINGMIGDQYRVKLNDNHEAWIPKNQVKLLPLGTFPPKSLTDSWAVYGGSKYDKIIVRLNEKLPFSTRQEVNPTRIIIDIYGATSNSNWITQHLSAKGIKNLYYEQAEKDLFRIIIEPTARQVWGYEIGYKNTSLEIKVKKQPSDLRISKLSFVIDAGHGGKNRGALGATGLLEKDVTLDIAKRIEKLLKKKGAKVKKTRTKDVYIKNPERLKKIKLYDADILISVHANSIGYASNPKKVSGTATFYKHIAFRPLSIAIYKRMLELDLKPFGNVGNFNFTLNSPTEILNVLVETAFMSNPNDEIKLMNSKFKDKIAEKIVQGVQDFLYECEDNIH